MPWASVVSIFPLTTRALLYMLLQFLDPHMVVYLPHSFKSVHSTKYLRSCRKGGDLIIDVRVHVPDGTFSTFGPQAGQQ